MSEANTSAADFALIVQTLNCYMQAIDLPDTSALRDRVFTSDARITLLEEVSLPEYCEVVADIMTHISTQHFLFNTVADVTGDQATARSYFVGYHRVKAGDQGPACEALFGRQSEEIDSVIGGVYEDELRRTQEGWRISRRNVKLVWQHQGAAAQLMSQNWLR
jgi:SnoaL-like domain